MITIGATISGTYNTSQGQTTDLMLEIADVKNNGYDENGNLLLGIIYGACMNRAAYDADKNDKVSPVFYDNATGEGFNMRQSITIAEGTVADSASIWEECRTALEARGLTVTIETQL